MNKDENSQLMLSILMPIFLPKPSVSELALLESSLDSIINQECDLKKEVVIVNDSPKALACHKYILQKIAGAGIEVNIVENGENRGIVYSLNRALSLSKGKYIARLDADDSWLPGKTRAQIGSMENNPNITLTGTSMVITDSTGREISTHIRKGLWDDVIDFAVNVGTPFPHSSIVARRDIFCFLGGYSPMRNFAHIEDFEMWSRWMRFFRVEYVDHMGLRYTANDKSISNKHTSLQSSNAVNLQQHLRKIFPLSKTTNLHGQISNKLNISELETGKFLYKIYRANRSVVPESTLELVRMFFPEFDFIVLKEADMNITNNHKLSDHRSILIEKRARLF